MTKSKSSIKSGKCKSVSRASSKARAASPSPHPGNGMAARASLSGQGSGKRQADLLELSDCNQGNAQRHAAWQQPNWQPQADGNGSSSPQGRMAPRTTITSQPSQHVYSVQLQEHPGYSSQQHQDDTGLKDGPSWQPTAYTYNPNTTNPATIQGNNINFNVQHPTPPNQSEAPAGRPASTSGVNMSTFEQLNYEI